jgi:hypothetical protein
MTDELIAHLRKSGNIWQIAAADALEAKERRIAELEEARDKAISFVKKQTDDKITLYDEQYALRQRIAELEKMLAVHRLAVDVDALKARIAELEALVKELADELAEYAHCGEDDNLVQAARAALENKHG